MTPVKSGLEKLYAKPLSALMNAPVYVEKSAGEKLECRFRMEGKSVTGIGITGFKHPLSAMCGSFKMEDVKFGNPTHGYTHEVARKLGNEELAKKVTLLRYTQIVKLTFDAMVPLCVAEGQGEYTAS